MPDQISKFARIVSVASKYQYLNDRFATKVIKYFQVNKLRFDGKLLSNFLGQCQYEKRVYYIKEST